MKETCDLDKTIVIDVCNNERNRKKLLYSNNKHIFYLVKLMVAGGVGMDGGLVLLHVEAVQNSGRATVITLYQCMEVTAAAAVRLDPPPAIPMDVQVI